MFYFFILSVLAGLTTLVIKDKLDSPLQRNIRNNLGGGGPGNFGADAVQGTPGFNMVQAQPSWWNESVGTYKYEVITPTTAGIRANDFRSLGDDYGGRQ